MKISATILTFLILVLTVIPCHDIPRFNSLHKVTEIAQNTETNNAPEDRDFCSPFCVCQCCQSNVLVIIPLIQNTFEGVTVNFSTYSKCIPNPEIVDFLIPPKS
jgi:hypothetical protein